MVTSRLQIVVALALAVLFGPAVAAQSPEEAFGAGNNIGDESLVYIPIRPRPNDGIIDG